MIYKYFFASISYISSRLLVKIKIKILKSLVILYSKLYFKKSDVYVVKRGNIEYT